MMALLIKIRSLGKHRRFVDLSLAAMLFSIAALVGFRYEADFGAGASYYQERMGAAVMWACGRGFVDPSLKDAPALDQFLHGKTPNLNPKDIPPGLPTQPASVWQKKHLYHYMACAFLWRLSGVSWAALYPLFALFYGATVALAYGIFRLGMGRIAALLGAFLVLVSPVHLAMLPVFRDYSKAPFLLAAFLILGFLVSRPLSLRRLYALAALYGALAGIGIGFRSDLFIVVPPFVATLLVFLPGGIHRNLLGKCAAFVAAAAMFELFGRLIIASTMDGSNAFHISLLGLTEPYDTMLGVSSMPYSLGPFYTDEYVASLVNGYERLFHGQNDFLAMITPPYEYYGRELYLSYLRHFPADMTVRGYAAILRILNELPFCDLRGLQNEALEKSNGSTQPLPLAFYAVRYAALHLFSGSGLILLAATLLLTGMRSLRVMLFGILFVLYFCGNTVLQFALRHAFHLEFISLWTLGFLLHHGCTHGFSLGKQAWLGEKRAALAALLAACRKPALWRTVAVLLCTGAALMGLLYGLRAYQQAHVAGLIRQYAAIQPQPLATDKTLDARGIVHVAPQDLFAGKKEPFAAEFLVADYAVSPSADLETATLYTANRNHLNWSTPMHFSSSLSPSGKYRLFLPAFRIDGIMTGSTEFQALLVRGNEAASLTQLGRVTDFGGLPLYLRWCMPAEGYDPAKPVPRLYQELTR